MDFNREFQVCIKMEGRTCWGAQCTVDENESVSHFRITFFILFFLRKHAQNKRRVYLMASTQVRSACNSRSRAMFLYCGKTIWISRPLPTSNTANSGSSHFSRTRRVFIFHRQPNGKESANQIMSLQSHHFLAPDPVTRGDEQLGNEFWSKEMRLNLTFGPPHIPAFKSVESPQNSPSFFATHPCRFGQEIRGRIDTNDVSKS